MTGKEKNEVFDSLPTCVAEFIKLVIKKMRYRKKVRLDVQAELAAHFEDELRSCKTDEQREQKAQQLIADFGDVKLLAVLLRRAKKRCRPLWRKALVRSFQVLGITVLYLLICSSRLLIGTPTISIDYVDWLNELVQAGRDESENAKPYYEKAVEVCVRMPDWLSKCRAKWPADFNNAEMKTFLEWISNNKETVELVRQGAAKSYYWPIYRGDKTGWIQETMMQNVMKPLGNYRKAAYTMKWKILNDAYNGDINSALDDCVVLQRFGSDLQGKGLLIEQMVGIAIEAIGCQTTLRILGKVDIPADVLRSVREKLEKNYGRQQAAINLEAEKAFWYDYVQRTFTDDGQGGGRPLIRGAPFAAGDWKDGLWKLVTFNYPDRREVTGGIKEYFRQAGKLLEKTPWQLHNKGFAAKRWDEIGKDIFMLRILGPARGKVSEISWRIKTDRAAMLTVLTLKQWQKEKEGYPDSLETLIGAGYLKELPMDPYSNKPLVYRKTDDNFILYSVGLNFVDDGGELRKGRSGKIRRWADEGDAVFWPVPKND